MSFDAVVAWIRAFLKNNQEKLVVFAYHREIVGDIAGAFQAPWITGETTKRKRAKAIERFTSDPACRLIVISILADSRGWNLGPARQALFVELGFTPADQQITGPAQNHTIVIYAQLFTVGQQLLDVCYLAQADVHGLG